MPYTQKWGISRNAFQSPLNDNGRRTIMEESKSLTDDSGNVIKTVDYNKDIIKQNNEIAQGELRFDNPFHEGFYLTPTKQTAKQIIKKTVPKTIMGNIAKVLGGTAMTTIGTFLGSQKAYAPNPTTFNFEEEFAQEDYAKEREGMTKSEIDEFNKINYLKSLPQSKSKHTLIQG